MTHKMLRIRLNTYWGRKSDATGNTTWRSVACSADGTRMVGAAMNNTASPQFLGGLYTSIDSGSTWVQTGAPQTNWATVASSSDGNRLVAAVQNGGIYTW